MGRLFDRRSGKALIVAYSHGILMGPRPGMVSLDEMRQATRHFAAADGLLIAPGMLPQLEEAFIGKDRPSLMIHLDYQNFSRGILPYQEGSTVELATIEDVVAAGADGVMTYMYLGYDDPERERAEVERNARLARACERWGVALMIEPRSAREATHPEDKTDPKIMGMYCRVAAEIGADIVKCIHPGSTEALAEIVRGCPVPLLSAGGSKAGSQEDAYRKAQSAMDAGASGLVYGRNIYEADDPAAALAHFRAIVHGE
jgi:DhnA family fructose-bisphosphate aldolase class Ia